MTKLRAPFPWFGGKSLAAPLIWRAFGNVPNYVEPFAGSLAVLLARPGGAGKVETANDKDGLISNFWRATRDKPDEVARYADWPVNEADLHARHRWLVGQIPGLTERLIADPEYSDAKIAGWWVWGICAWIGNGWCMRDERVDLPLERRRPELANAHGRGVHTLHRSLPDVGPPGHGLHVPAGKKPLTHRGKGVHRNGAGDLAELFGVLAARLRGVRVCCGEWYRVLGRSTLGIDTAHGMTPCGVLLDPPYAHDERGKKLYRHDSSEVSAAVRAWALENGDNPALRIALCGWDGEHAMPPPLDTGRVEVEGQREEPWARAHLVFAALPAGERRRSVRRTRRRRRPGSPAVIPAQRQTRALWAILGVALAAGALLWVLGLLWSVPVTCGVMAFGWLAAIQLWRCAARASLLRIPRDGGER